MTEKIENNNSMPSKGVRLRTDQWDDCDRIYKRLGLNSRNDFIRDAVDFYIEWLNKGSSEKFLTPALESVISGKVRDSEERLARLLFKIAVDQNLLSHIIGNAYDYDEHDLESWRRHSIKEVSNTNGTLRTDEIILSKNR